MEIWQKVAIAYHRCSLRDRWISDLSADLKLGYKPRPFRTALYLALAA